MKRFRLLAVLGALALCTATVVWGDYNVLDKRTYYQNATSGLRTNSTGDLRVDDMARDRDFPLLTNLFDGQSILAGGTYTMTQGTSVMQYTRMALHLTWTCAAADTDSVRIAVRVYGMTNQTGGNWYLWTPLATYTQYDTCETSGQVDADSTGTGRCLKPISFWVGKGTTKYTLGATTMIGATQLYDGTLTTASAKMVKVRKIPLSCLRWGSANGVVLSLSDNSGAPFLSPYIRIEVTNCTKGVTLSNVAANIWPRVQ